MSSHYLKKQRQRKKDKLWRGNLIHFGNLSGKVSKGHEARVMSLQLASVQKWQGGS